MIGKAKSCIGGFSLFNYVINPNKGYELMRNNLCGETPLEIMQEMKIIQNQNQRATNKLISMVLSPHVEDGEKLNKKELKELVKQFLEELQVDPNQADYLAFVHTEKHHVHIHLLLNRVQKDSTLIPDHHIGKKAQWAAHRVALKNGLISAKQVRIDRIKESEKIQFDSKKIRKDIYNKHVRVIAKNPVTMEKYLGEMRKSGIEFIPTINRQGELQGYRIRDMESQMEMKASDVHRKMSLKGLLDAGLKFENDNYLLNPQLKKICERELELLHQKNPIEEYQEHKEKGTKSILDNILSSSYTSKTATANDPENDLWRKKRKKRR